MQKVIDQFSRGNGTVVSVKTLEQEVISFSEKHQERLLQPMERAEKETEELPHKQTAEKPFLVQANQIVPFLLIMLYLMTFMFSFTEILVLVLMAGIFMTLAQYFRSSMYPCKLTWKQTANITLYSTFPPLLIASLFTAFQLPFVTFQLIFFITFFIYQITAFGFVIHSLNPLPERSDDDFDF